MTSRMWTKPETQRTIKRLRAAGYNVAKVNEMYKILDDDGEVWTRDGRALFSAMAGGRGYLVSYHPDLMDEAERNAQRFAEGWPYSYTEALAD